MAREKIKFALRIAPETQQLVKELCERDNCQSQNEFIEKAIRFYAGYVSGKEATAYHVNRVPVHNEPTRSAHSKDFI